MQQIINTFLTDPETGNKHEVQILIDKQGIAIQPEGYAAEDGESAPIYLEYYNGDFRIGIFDEVHQENMLLTPLTVVEQPQGGSSGGSQTS